MSATDQYRGFPVANVTVNGKAVSSDVPPIIVDGRTLLPVKFVVDAVGGTVDWDQGTLTANITAPDTAAQAGENAQLKARIAELEQSSGGTTVLTAEQLARFRNLLDLERLTDDLTQQGLVYQTLLFKQMWYQTAHQNLSDDLMWQDADHSFAQWMDKARLVADVVAELPDLKDSVLKASKVTPSGISTYLLLTHDAIAQANDLTADPVRFKAMEDTGFADLGKLLGHLTAFNKAARQGLEDLVLRHQ